ncbi:hypothetical protein [Paraherbaspirillum soli]|uniref:Uncharacterized protein n=1 Tax=Paraherbaspirillum soli TaxID=631222 RepID=A0ABW0MD89_9BURK
MDSIQFEKVSISEAKAVLDDDQRARQEKNWEHFRRMISPSDLELKEATYHWLLTLPIAVWPLWLAKHFPRIANHLAEVWRQPAVCEDLFVELLLDQRGTRKGFPEEVSREIMALKLYFETKAAPAKIVPQSAPVVEGK